MGHERSHYNLLSSQLLEKVFRLLPFQHKVRCEAVCKGWRELLRSPPRGIWGDILHVSAFISSNNRVKIALECIDVAHPSVQILAKKTAHTEAEYSFVRWLALRGVGVNTLTLTYSNTGPSWLFAQLLYAVHLAAQSAHERFNLHLHAELSLVLESAKSCHLLSEVLTEWTAPNTHDIQLQLQPLTALTRLTCLDISNARDAGHISAFGCMTSLHSLHLADYYNLDNNAYSLRGLQNLVLSGGTDTCLDLTYLSRLTSLQILEFGSELNSITLPAGSAAGTEQVPLRHLSIRDDSADVDDLHRVSLNNLDLAQQLTCLYIACCKPLLQHNWARGLIQLRRVVLRSVVGVPLCEELTACAALQQLDLTESDFTEMPSWLSRMTQLTSLNLNMTSLASFPDAVIHLSQLHHLSMAKWFPPFALKSEILTLAQWPNLRMIDLRIYCDHNLGEECDLDTQLTLLELQAMLTKHNRDCHLMIDTSNIWS